MNLQQIADSFVPMTCIMSVQVFDDGSYGNIRIVCGNKPYVDSIENPDNIAFSVMLKNKFIPDSPYERYIPKDLNFEDACYRCAVMKKPFHTYIHPKRYDFWVDMYMMPLTADEGNTYYLAYSQELTSDAISSRMSNLDAAVTSAVIETCIKLRGTKDFKNTMDEVISDIRSLCEADKVCLILTDAQKRSFSVLSEAASTPEGNYPVEDYLRANYEDFYDIIETWEDTIAGSTCLIIQNEKDMSVLNERNPVWCESLKLVNVKTIVLFPLKNDDETIGYIWALNFATEKTTQIRATLESSSFFIASEIVNRQLMDKLRKISSFDILTGVKNRNAMNQRIDDIIDGKDNLPEKTAVIFVDLNGLKQINDNGGHATGDRLLKLSADILKNTFADSDIYRAGGDEFMVLAANISEKELEERLESLRLYRTGSEEVSFALGYCYSEGEIDIRQAMSVADKRMYADKQFFYEKYPERRRK
ncbi:sensor domain-containing diguanylate cyclase [Ruminococcus flavefaciens]|uniref:Diguanylate cyclase (GGDEF) domain-containing protein n=1 Tax=Ruminococcus flavefaciens TaxID=1265 RepID=A0A1M7HPH5_RUMFL|nr:GGDEF domain-containing protein [Ruminococcus flavefaciens]SHM30319.1 diguanylate cyclase (GGDEF) domain-containing protein [Ruminococcus flavefaciens]